MNEIILRFWIYIKGKNKEFIIKVNKSNYYIIKFIIEKELNKIRERLINYVNFGVIKTISKNPKVYLKDKKKQINDILISRRSLLNAMRLLKKQKKDLNTL